MSVLLPILCFIFGGCIGVAIMCLLTASHRQNENDDPHYRRPNRPIIDNNEPYGIYAIACYIASQMEDKYVTVENILNMLLLCQIHHLAWLNTVLFPAYFIKKDGKIVCCDLDFTEFLENIPKDANVKEYIMANCHFDNLPEAEKVDIELTIHRHMHSDTNVLIKENPVFVDTEDGHLLSYIKLRNAYSLEDDVPSEIIDKYDNKTDENDNESVNETPEELPDTNDNNAPKHFAQEEDANNE